MDGPCDQDFALESATDALFLYPSSPATIATTIQAAVTRLKQTQSFEAWKTWRELRVEGQVIFCQISKAVRFARNIVADVTTLNFNLMFEIGFAIGLSIAVVPIRDTTYVQSKRDFAELGVLDTLGYVDFANADELHARLVDVLPADPLPRLPDRSYPDAPIYVLRGPIATEGVVRMMSTLKKSGLNFRTYDPLETPRLSLHEVRRQVHGSVGVVANLLSHNREGSAVHNALAAFVAGMAMAQEKVVVMLQEEPVPQPVDYRDLVQPYNSPDEIPTLLERPIRQAVEHMQRTTAAPLEVPSRALERVDLGDIAAENELGRLKQYFVQTGQYRQARHGHARLVVGRKGTGKTALFYGVRNSLGRGYGSLVLDLKPEGHQFMKLREAVLADMPEGLQEHTMTAFWHYMLLAEIAHKILKHEARYAQRDGTRWERYQRLEELYFEHELVSGDVDLSQRLVRQVDRMIARHGNATAPLTTESMTTMLYGGDIRLFEEAVSEYLREKESVWLLIDNLDKGWKTRGVSPEQVLILRSLLEASRKLQQHLETYEVEFKSLVFIRADVYEFLVRETPDKGKDTAIMLDWDDAQVFREVVRRRLTTADGVSGDFRRVWGALFDSHVGAEASFEYILRRTLMRPRDLLLFLQGAVQVALNRGHARVTAEDIRKAEQAYSEDMLFAASQEIADTSPEWEDVVFAFQGAEPILPRRDVVVRLLGWGVDEDAVDRLVELLVWFGFIGVWDGDEGKYSYAVRYNLRQLMHRVNTGKAPFVVHPAYRAALDIAATV